MMCSTTRRLSIASFALFVCGGLVHSNRVMADHGGNVTDRNSYPGSICEGIGEEAQPHQNPFVAIDFQNPNNSSLWVQCPLIREDPGHARPTNVDVYVQDYHTDENIRCRIEAIRPKGTSGCPICFGSTYVSTTGTSSKGTQDVLHLGNPPGWKSNSFGTQFSVVCELPGHQDGNEASSIVAIRYDAKTEESGTIDHKGYPGATCQVGDFPPRSSDSGTGNFYSNGVGSIYNATGSRVDEVHCPVIRDDRQANAGVAASTMSWQTPVHVYFRDRHPNQVVRCRRVVRYPDGTVERGEWSTSGSEPDGTGVGILTPPHTFGQADPNAMFSLHCELPPAYNGNASAIFGYRVAEVTE